MSKTSILLSLIDVALPIATGAIVIASAVGLAASLDSIWPSLHFSPVFAPVALIVGCLVIGPPTVSVQSGISWWCSRKLCAWRRRYMFALAPAIGLSLLIVLSAVWQARPAGRFRQIVGVAPPPGASGIVYTRRGDPMDYVETVEWTMPVSEFRPFVQQFFAARDAMPAELQSGENIRIDDELSIMSGFFSVIWRNEQSIRLQAQNEFDFS